MLQGDGRSNRGLHHARNKDKELRKDSVENFGGEFLGLNELDLQSYHHDQDSL